jgi:hypothetical protein
MYSVAQPTLYIPLAVPNLAYVRSTRVTVRNLKSAGLGPVTLSLRFPQCLTEEPVSAPIKIHVYVPPRAEPVVTTVATMPVAEPLATIR